MSTNFYSVNGDHIVGQEFSDDPYEETYQRLVCEEKNSYPDEPTAQHYLTKILRRAESGNAKPGYPTSVYKCRFGEHWHLTSHKWSRDKRKIEA